MSKAGPLVAVCLTSLILACSAPDDSPLVRADAADGQWIWSTADAARFAESRRTLPALVPGVWVATVAFARDSVTQRLALSPAAGQGAPIAAVVRFDDAFHAAW